MTVRVVFAAGADLWAEYRSPLEAAFRSAGLAVHLSDRASDPDAVDYIVCSPGGTISDFTPYRRCKAVLNLWAGVERLVTNPTLTMPLARMVIPGMTESMVEYVAANVLRHHLGLDRFIRNPAHEWNPEPAPPNARDRRVTVLGMGDLGSACATALAALNFNVTGWSRSARSLAGVDCLAGREALPAALGRAEILVLLLPLTDETRDILNARTLAMLPRGAMIVNAGRGALIDDGALIAALESGHVAHATLDVFRREPLPRDHPFWHHPGVTVTPHIAAKTPVGEASRMVAENIRRSESGEPMLNLVDRAKGY
ncbi:MAG: 2-hydroxyacid dehydrogenase [Pseudomonadota bacterium]